LPTRNDFGEVLESVDLLLLALKTLRAMGPHFEILHRYRQPGSDCCPGEEVAAVNLIHWTGKFLVPLGCPLLIVCDYMAHHSHRLETASQIVSGIWADPFYQKHGANAATRVRLTREIGRSSFKVYVQRLRAALGRTFSAAQLPLDPYDVLSSEPMSSNVVGYRLRATFDWIHVDHPGQ
jgi:hypothetical protein